MTARELALKSIRRNSNDGPFDGRGWHCLMCGSAEMVVRSEDLRHEVGCSVAQVLSETKAPPSKSDLVDPKWADYNW